MKHRIEVYEKCRVCRGTGLYIGMAEKDGAAIVCYKCKGTGCCHTIFEYEDFKGRIRRDKVEQVYECNPGIIIGKGGGKYKLSDFGGIPYREWDIGKPFIKAENRDYTCPKWWFQVSNSNKELDWQECNDSWVKPFSQCKFFRDKDKCWDRFDEED